MPTDIWTSPAMGYLDCIDEQKPLIKAQNPLKASRDVRREAEKRCEEKGDATRSSLAAGRKS